MRLAFLACVERGNLENQTRLLCRSIRRFGGRLRHAPIHTFQPRRGTAITPESLADLEALGVQHHTEILNPDFDHYPIGNKILVSAWAEEQLEETLLVFLDSDTLLLAEPSDWLLPEGLDAAASPCVRWLGGIASSGPADPVDPYWREAYRLCGVNARPFVRSLVDRRRVRAYFNGGLVVARRRAGLFRQWREDFLCLMRRRHFPPDPKRGINNMDEISLGITLARVFDRVRILDERHNYPLHRRAELAAPASHAQFEELVHVHYHGWFNQPGYLASLDPPFDNGGRIRAWLEPFLPFTPHLEGGY